MKSCTANIWSKWESAARCDIESCKLERLKETVAYAYSRVPFYKARLDEAKVSPTDIQCLDDIRRIPFTTKQDFRDTYPFGLFAVPPNELSRIHSSSGTTGKPTVVGYTDSDLKTWAELVARIVVMGGVTATDVAQIAFGYGMFTGAFGLHYGLERVGAAVVPLSSGNTERQLMFLEDFGTTVLISTPSYAAYLAEQANLRGTKHCLKWGLFGAEPWTEGMRRRIESDLRLVATDNYGMSELGGPGFSGECALTQSGMHISEDMYVWEVLDPISGEPVPEGTIGELVVTPLWKEALPVLRYRTRDLTAIVTDACQCGRTTARMSKVTGRTDDMLIIRGVNVFPSQIEHILLETEGTSSHYLLVVSHEHSMDNLEIWVEMSEKLFLEAGSQLKAVTDLRDSLTKTVHSILGLSARIKLVEPQTIERSQGKAKRVLDKRNL